MKNSLHGKWWCQWHDRLPPRRVQFETVEVIVMANVPVEEVRALKCFVLLSAFGEEAEGLQGR